MERWLRRFILATIGWLAVLSVVALWAGDWFLFAVDTSLCGLNLWNLQVHKRRRQHRAEQQRFWQMIVENYGQQEEAE